MGEAYFYHLTRRSAEEALPQLLRRALAQGWRCVVRGTDERRLARLDAKLWAGEGFLPHGLAGGPHDARQPVLLSVGAEAGDCLLAVDGASVEAAEVGAARRVCIVFDGMDETALAGARALWTALTGAGCGARYWSEDSGKWVEKATRNV